MLRAGASCTICAVCTARVCATPEEHWICEIVGRFNSHVSAGAKIPTPSVVNRSPLRTEEVPRLGLNSKEASSRFSIRRCVPRLDIIKALE